ncbi:translation initiation factor IF-2-like [Triticum urartu]|uniref:translation initiation factor IF-2-like n=1 Tax=Triticum urartu TaxID=4572 RepID=UPI002043E064|nr:translation initiation factor IF-2-like [Triticum urartu]XP_048529078.1 translation initiation factor IF-2-like [Triticum urartu]XP_048529079.1 translation initiation factor IF-2-like [Triticum urartu]XP_048529080.1 translation initiation factor IF-2-like [Triticum urartu]
MFGIVDIYNFLYKFGQRLPTHPSPPVPPLRDGGEGFWRGRPRAPSSLLLSRRRQRAWPGKARPGQRRWGLLVPQRAEERRGSFSPGGAQCEHRVPRHDIALARWGGGCVAGGTDGGGSRRPRRGGTNLASGGAPARGLKATRPDVPGRPAVSAGSEVTGAGQLGSGGGGACRSDVVFSTGCRGLGHRPGVAVAPAIGGGEVAPLSGSGGFHSSSGHHGSSAGRLDFWYRLVCRRPVSTFDPSARHSTTIFVEGCWPSPQLRSITRLTPGSRTELDSRLAAGPCSSRAQWHDQARLTPGAVGWVDGGQFSSSRVSALGAPRGVKGGSFTLIYLVGVAAGLG